jgi:hypothetical protein
VLHARDVGDLAGHHPTVVEEEEHVLVPLGPVGADHGLARPGGCGPVDAADLIVDPVLAQLVELRAAPAPLGGAEAHLQDAPSGDPELGVLTAREGGVDAEQRRQGNSPLARTDPQRPVDAHDDPADLEAAAAARTHLGGAAEHRPRRERAAQAAGGGAQRRRQLVGQGQAHGAVGGVPHAPRELARAAQHDHRCQVALDLEAAGVDREEHVHQHQRREADVDGHQHAQHPVDRQPQHQEGERDRGQRGSARGDRSHEQPDLSAGRGRWRAPRRGRCRR